MTDSVDKLYLSKLTVPSGVNGAAQTFDLKDAEARVAITALENAVADGIHFIGATTSAIVDGKDLKPIVVNGENVTPKAGDLVVKGEEEFVYDGSKWLKFGDLGALGKLAFVDQAQGSYTPAGSVSAEFSGTAATISVTGSASGDVAISVGNGTANYTPEGSVSASFTGQEGDLSVTGTPSGSVTISTGSGDANYTPAGSVSADFSGSEGDLSVTGVATGNVAISVGSGATNYTPAGSVAAPTISVASAGATDTVYSITDVGSLPALSTSVANENLTISFNQGALPTKGEAQTVKTGDASYSASAPAFTGTAVDLEAAFTGTSFESTGKFTPSGNIVNAEFSGTGVDLEAAFSGNQLTSAGKFSPSGSISASFTGTGVDLEAAFSNGSVTASGAYTPAGSVTASFSGTADTIVVAPAAAANP